MIVAEERKKRLEMFMWLRSMRMDKSYSGMTQGDETLYRSR